jgi:hypothetical protein
MFRTNNVFKLPLQSMFSAAEETYWSAVEIEFTSPLFLVSFRNPNETDSPVVRTIIFTDLEQVVQMVKAECTGETEIDDVILMSAQNLNGSENWKTDRLAAVWALIEPDQPEKSTYVYETCRGEEYLPSNLQASSFQRKERRLLVRFSKVPGEQSCS